MGWDLGRVVRAPGPSRNVPTEQPRRPRTDPDGVSYIATMTTDNETHQGCRAMTWPDLFVFILFVVVDNFKCAVFAIAYKQKEQLKLDENEILEPKFSENPSSNSVI